VTQPLKDALFCGSTDFNGHNPHIFSWCGLDLAQQLANADLVAKATVVSRNDHPT
jgi:hypothetical protein